MTRRRDVLAGICLAGLSSLFPRWAIAAKWQETLFQVKSLADAERAFADRTSSPSTDIVLIAPDIAENGAVVPISITTTLSNVEEIAFLVERNPNTVAASFRFPAGTEPMVTTRVKLGQTSDVVALVKTDKGLFSARRTVKVTLGGCGG